MRVSVAGLWHLGTVTAACCASGGHHVVAFDDDYQVIAGLQQGRLPVDEPGLAEMTRSVVGDSKLRFTSDVADTAAGQVLWICYDTPVNEDDVADVEFVTQRIEHLLSALEPGAIVLISSQMPVGSTAKLEQTYPQFRFAYSPENLRLGKAIEVFTKPDRVVIGVREPAVRVALAALFAPFTDNLEWMSIESAEMTKHALNAFLATSVAFINEIATICEKTGADGQEVERGLKSDVRIGSKAYLHPGGAFAGGTLARDLAFLIAVGEERGLPTSLFQGVKNSNSAHRLWTQRRLTDVLGNLRGNTVAILGLTYKPGTNTLRRSTAVETCRWLLDQGATVQAFDPAIHEMPKDLLQIHLTTTAELALRGADAALIATPWPKFRSLTEESFVSHMRRAVVLDPARDLETLFAADGAVEFPGIGISRCS